MKHRTLVDDRWIAPHGLGRFAKEVISRMKNYTSVPRKLAVLSILDSFWISYVICNDKPDLYFSPGFNPPIYSKSPYIFTIGDLIHLKVAEERSFFKILYYQTVVKSATKKAKAVLTFSEYSRNEIIQWSGMDPSRIHNVQCGVGKDFSPAGEKYEPGYPYLIYVGNRKPHKNLHRLMLAFSRSKIDSSYCLLLSGQRDENLLETAKKYNIQDRIHFAGLISDADLPKYYRGARGLTFPSLYEGFGLPPLEAMACGTPVLTSNTTSLPEVVGDSALLVDPKNIEQIQVCIETIVNDDDIHKKMSALGLERAKQFTWENTFKKISKIIASD